MYSIVIAVIKRVIRGCILNSSDGDVPGSSTSQSSDRITLSKLSERFALFMGSIPHCRELNMALVKITQAGVVVKLPYSDKLVGNPETGVIHGGAITTLMDQASGLAVACAIAPGVDITPTIDLRVDYMGPAEPHHDVLGFVEAYRVTRNVVFTRGVAYHDSVDRPIASCVATFMRMGFGKSYWD